MNSFHVLVISFVLLYVSTQVKSGDDGFKREKTHLKKDPRDYTDRDVDSLYDEWEVRFYFRYFNFMFIDVFHLG